MASILDLGDLTEEVEIRGVKLTVQGVTAGHIFQLFASFPDMRRMLTEKEGSPQAVLLDLAPELIAKLIVLALDESPENREAAEAKAKKLGASDQLAILSAVQRLSFKNGVGPFVDEVNALMSASEELEIPSPISSPSTINLRPPSIASLQMDTPGLLRGHARHVN
jgi:hypothetical protein